MLVALSGEYDLFRSVTLRIYETVADNGLILCQHVSLRDVYGPLI